MNQHMRSLHLARRFLSRYLSDSSKVAANERRLLER